MDQGTMPCPEHDPTSIAFLKRRLCESGWLDEVRILCEEVIEGNGNCNMTSEELAAKVKPQATLLVPDSIKQELLWDIRNREINKHQVEN